MASITSQLSPGMSSPQVKALQQFLNSQGYAVAPSGQPGSIGYETDYFGPATQAALQRYQAAMGIVTSGSPTTTGYGNLGPQTLARINSVMSGGSSSYGSNPQDNQMPTVDTKQLGKRYGYEINRAAENRAVAAFDGFMNLLKTGAAGDTNMSQKILNQIANDDSLVGFYVNALAYGGYTLQDVYMDMTREGYASSGKGSKVRNIEPISATIEAPNYKASKAYDAVEQSDLMRISPTIAGLDSFVTTLPVLQMPDDAFRQLNPLPDPSSPAFREEMEKYKSATYETALQIADAQNEVEHTRALESWNRIKTEVEDRLGITLSNNASEAWQQIQSFQQQAAENGIAGSGIEAREIDNYLKQQMRSNSQARDYYESQDEAKEAEYYQNFASPEEIAQLDPAKAAKYGLIPDEETLKYLDINNLKQMFPDTPEADLLAIRNKYLDPSGNMFSTLYGNYASAKYDTNQNYNTDKASKVLLKAQQDAEDALKQYSDPNNPYLRTEGMDSNQRSVSDPNQPLTKKQTTTSTKTNTSTPSTTNTSTYTAPKVTTSTPTPYVAPKTTVTPPKTTTTPAPVKPASTGIGSGLSISSTGQVIKNGLNLSAPSTSNNLLSGTGKNATATTTKPGVNINLSGIGTAIKNTASSAANSIKKLFGF